jgi:hypothetical protein
LSLSGTTSSRPYPQSTELLPPAIILVVMLLGWRIIHRNPPRLSRWLWISLLLAVLNVLLLPVTIWVLGVGLADSSEQFTFYAFPEYYPLVDQLFFPILCLFAFFPTLTASFNLWILRREIG